jgi:hypothetical protein
MVCRIKAISPKYPVHVFSTIFRTSLVMAGTITEVAVPVGILSTPATLPINVIYLPILKPDVFGKSAGSFSIYKYFK